MKRLFPIVLRALCAMFALWSLYAWYRSGTQLISHFRLREVPVEVLRSSLLIDAPVDQTGEPIDLTFNLRLDLITTDGAQRHIHWEGAPGRAAYPEEAFDELKRWGPGYRTTIKQVRGEARAIRLTAFFEAPELDSAWGFAIFAIFLGLIALALLGVSTNRNSRYSGIRWVHKRLGAWTVFFVIGATFLIGSTLFAASHFPKLHTWPRVTAVIQSKQTSYAAADLPPNVVITRPARTRLENSSYRILAFVWNGTPIHGAMGSWEGPYDDLSQKCTLHNDTCEFLISPVDRWSAVSGNSWDRDLFVPLGMFLFFGLAFTGAGLAIRRQTM